MSRSFSSPYRLTLIRRRCVAVRANRTVDNGRDAFRSKQDRVTDVATRQPPPRASLTRQLGELAGATSRKPFAAGPPAVTPRAVTARAQTLGGLARTGEPDLHLRQRRRGSPARLPAVGRRAGITTRRSVRAANSVSTLCTYYLGRGAEYGEGCPDCLSERRYPQACEHSRASSVRPTPEQRASG